MYPPAMHDFLRKCSEPEPGRVGSGALIKVRPGFYVWGVSELNKILRIRLLIMHVGEL